MATYNNVFGAVFELDIDDLKSGLAESKKQITTANKEFNAATAGMDDWTKSSEGLQAKLKQLDTVLDNQKKNVKGYEAEIERVKNLEGDHTEQLRRLNDKLLDAQAAVAKTEKAQRKYSAELQQVEQNTREATTETGKLTNSLKKADDATTSLKGGFTVLKGAMANLVSSGIQQMVSGLQSIVSESREFRREMAYLQSGADAAGESFDNAKENVREVTSITEDQGAAIEGLNNLLASGFSGDALDKITDQLLGASIKWKDTLKFEGLSDGLQETLATGSAVGPFAEMLERAGMDLDTFNAGLADATTEADKQNYVLNTLSSLGLSEIKDGYVEANKTLVDGAKAEYDYSEAMANIGEKAEPVLTTVKQGWVDVLNAFMSGSDGLDTADFQGKIKNAFQWFIETCVPIIKDAISFVLTNIQPITVGIVGIGGAFVAWKVGSIISEAVSGLKNMATWLMTARTNSTLLTIAENARAAATAICTTVTTAATTAFRALNAVMKANPILWVVSLIAILVTAFVTLWNKSEAFRNFWIGLWEGIKNACKVAVDAIVGFMTGAWNIIQSAWNGAVSFFSGIWSGIKNVFSSVGSWFGSIFSSAWNNITSVFGSVGSWFRTNVLDKIVSVFTDLPQRMFQIGADMLNGLIDGVRSMITSVTDAVTNAVDSAVKGVKNFLGIKSPSRLMRDEVGKMMGLGVGEGILSSSRSVLKDAQRFTDTISGGLSTSIPAISASPAGYGMGASGRPVTNVTNNYNQTINAPKQPSRLELYRQSKNLLSLKGGY